MLPDSFWRGLWDFLEHRSFCEILLISHLVMLHFNIAKFSERFMKIITCLEGQLRNGEKDASNREG